VARHATIYTSFQDGISSTHRSESSDQSTFKRIKTEAFETVASRVQRRPRDTWMRRVAVELALFASKFRGHWIHSFTSPFFSFSFKCTLPCTRAPRYSSRHRISCFPVPRALLKLMLIAKAPVYQHHHSSKMCPSTPPDTMVLILMSTYLTSTTKQKSHVLMPKAQLRSPSPESCLRPSFSNINGVSPL
jgi:hypothetical protein